MDPGAVLHPVGPKPPRTYWIRRAGLIVVVVVAVVLVAHACSGGGAGKGDDRAAGDRQRISTTPTPTVSDSASHEPLPRCRHSALQVTAASDAETYAAGVLPRFTAVVRNVGATACRFPSQPSARAWTVESGADRIWS